MIAQLTHLRPKPGNVDRVIALLEEWGQATRDEASRPLYSFLCRDEDHLFLVSLHTDRESYATAASAGATWLERLMPLLVDGHGPTYHGPVLAQEGSVVANDMTFPAAIKIGPRLL